MASAESAVDNGTDAAKDGPDLPEEAPHMITNAAVASVESSPLDGGGTAGNPTEAASAPALAGEASLESVGTAQLMADFEGAPQGKQQQATGLQPEPEPEPQLEEGKGQASENGIEEADSEEEQIRDFSKMLDDGYDLQGTGEKKDFATMMLELVKSKKEHTTEDEGLFAPKSCGIFPRDHKLRLICQRYYYAEKVQKAWVAIVVTSCIVVVLQGEYHNEGELETATDKATREILLWASIGINIACMVDAMIRIVAMGFVADPRAYLRKVKYQVELVTTMLLFLVEINEMLVSASLALNMVAVGWLIYLCGVLQGLGMGLRWLRPLVFVRMLTRVRGLQLLVRTMAEAIPQLSLMIIMAGLILVTASIFGVHMWNALFRNKCYSRDALDQGSWNDSFSIMRPPFVGEGVSGGVRSRLCAITSDPTKPNAALSRACNVDGEQGIVDGVCDSTLAWSALVSSPVNSTLAWSALVCAQSPTNLFPHEKSLSFDTIGMAFLLMFQVITLSSWSQVMYLVMDVDTSYFAVPFFVLVVVFGAYFLSNLTIAILKAKFDSAVSEILKELEIEEKVTQAEYEIETQEQLATAQAGQTEQALWQKAGSQARAVTALNSLKLSFEDNSEDVNKPNVAFSMAKWQQARATIMSARALAASGSQDAIEAVKRKAEKKRQATMDMLGMSVKAPSAGLQGVFMGGTVVEEDGTDVRGTNSTPQPKVAVGCKYKTRRFFKKITTSQTFEHTFIFLTLFNTVLLMCEFHDQSQSWTLFLEVGNYSCAILFAIEMTMRLIAENMSYFKQPFNIFDSFIVVSSLLDLIFQMEVGISAARSFRILRLFRVLRVMRVLRYLDTLKTITLIVLRCIPHVTWVVLMLLTVMSLYAEVGVILFRGKFDFPHGQPRAHFDNFFYAFVSMFQVLTLDDWEFIMYDAIEAVGGWDNGWQAVCVALFFTSWIIIGVWLLLNVLTILILSRFAKEESSKDEQARKILSKAFANSALISTMIKAEPTPTDSRARRVSVDENTLVQRRARSKSGLFLTEAAPSNSNAVHPEPSAATDVENQGVAMPAVGESAGNGQSKISLPGQISPDDASPPDKTSALVGSTVEVEVPHSPTSPDELSPKPLPSLGDKDTRPTNWATTLITNPWFDRFVLVLIIANTVTLALETPCLDMNSQMVSLQLLHLQLQ